MIMAWNLDQWYWYETKLHKRNKTTSKKIADDVISENCDVILIFPIYGQINPEAGFRMHSL